MFHHLPFKTMADSSYDVIVVGAGPAGLIAAEILATKGFNIAILEKDRVPGKDKPCGGFLTLKGVKDGRIPSTLAERVTNGISLSIPNFPVYHIDYPKCNLILSEVLFYQKLDPFLVFSAIFR